MDTALRERVDRHNPHTSISHLFFVEISRLTFFAEHEVLSPAMTLIIPTPFPAVAGQFGSSVVKVPAGRVFAVRRDTYGAGQA